MKNKKDVKFRHKFIITLVKPFVTLIYRLKYGYKFKRYRDLKNKGPFLILGNHTILSDPLFMSLSFPFHIYYFATEQIFNLGLLSRLLIWAVNPIKKSKSINDVTSIRKARKIVREGGSVAVYPEGNTTYDGQTLRFNESIVKLIKFLKIPVVLFVTEGLYLSNSRWQVNKRKGKSKGYIKQIIYPEEYLNLNEKDLYELVYNGLYINAYDKDENLLFKGKDKALGLERLVFMDLKENVPFENFTKKNKLFSKVSDFELEVLNDGYIVDGDGNKYTTMELHEKTLISYYNYYKDINNDIHFKTSVIAELTTSFNKEQLENASLTLNCDRLVLKHDDEELIINFDDIQTGAIQGKNKIIIYTEKNTWLFTFKENISPYAYLITYQLYKKGEKLYEDEFDVRKLGL